MNTWLSECFAISLRNYITTLKSQNRYVVPRFPLHASYFDVSREKNRRPSSIFDACWRNEVSNFRLGKFEQVEPFCDLYEPDVDINTKNSLDNSGSNETMQKVLASIV